MEVVRKVLFFSLLALAGFLYFKGNDYGINHNQLFAVIGIVFVLRFPSIGKAITVIIGLFILNTKYNLYSLTLLYLGTHKLATIIVLLAVGTFCVSLCNSKYNKIFLMSLIVIGSIFFGFSKILNYADYLGSYKLYGQIFGVITLCYTSYKLSSFLITPLEMICQPLNKVVEFIIPLKWSLPEFTFGSKENIDLATEKTMEEIDDFGKGEASQTVKGDMFEDFICSCWKRMGYEAYTVAELKAMGKHPETVNPNVRADKGLDVVVYRMDEDGVPYIYFIQAKHYSNPLNSTPVYEVLKAEYNWKGVFKLPVKKAVWTNSTFTEDAEQEARNTEVELIDRIKLALWLKNEVKIKKIRNT